MIFALSGLSESGKSTAGRYLDAPGIQRLKITRFVNEVKTADGAGAEEYGAWIERTRQERPGWLCQQFTRHLLAYQDAAGGAPLSIESLYDPGLARHLKGHLGAQFVILFIEIPREVRLVRQMGREKLAALQEAAALLDPRDTQKVRWGALEVQAMADHVIDNAGNLEQLHVQLHGVLSRYGLTGASAPDARRPWAPRAGRAPARRDPPDGPGRTGPDHAR